MKDSITTAFRRFLSGEISISDLQSLLAEILASEPSAAPELARRLAELLAKDRLPLQLHNLLMELVPIQVRPVRQPPPGTATRLKGGGAPGPVVPQPPPAASPPAPEPDQYGETLDETGYLEKLLEPGALIHNRFLLEERIGMGGMGDVYRALDRLMEEAQDPDPYIALKVIGEAIREYPEAPIALQREGRRAQSLSHPNIVKVFHFGHDTKADTYYLTMELLRGQSFGEILDDNLAGLSFSEASPLIEQLCAGISYAHSQGIVHSDIKPSNILLTVDGVVKVLDFGIAMPLRAAGGRETRFNPRRLGALSPAHASVEVWLGMDPDQRDDVYSVGCVVYELLTGRHPFEGEEAPRAMDRKLKVAPVKGLTPAQNAALRDALAFTREQRSPSIEHFANQLLKSSRSSLFASPIFRGAIAGIAILGLVAVLWTWSRPAAEPGAIESVDSSPPVVVPSDPLEMPDADLPSPESLPPRVNNADECANLEARWDLLSCADRRACFAQRATVAETTILVAPPESVDMYMARAALNRDLATMTCDSLTFERDRLYREFQTEFPGIPVN